MQPSAGLGGAVWGGSRWARLHGISVRYLQRIARQEKWRERWDDERWQCELAAMGATDEDLAIGDARLARKYGCPLLW